MTEPPVWGTAPQRFEPQPAVVPMEPGTGGYFLVIEQLTGSADSAVWRVDPDPIWAGSTRDQARAAAVQCARQFSPRQPRVFSASAEDG